jgi:hypothetical protein
MKIINNDVYQTLMQETLQEAKSEKEKKVSF